MIPNVLGVLASFIRNLITHQCSSFTASKILPKKAIKNTH